MRLYPGVPTVLPNLQTPATCNLGKNDLAFVPAGAKAFTRDNPNAIVQFLDTGHFALETHVEEISISMRRFLAQAIPAASKERS